MSGTPEVLLLKGSRWSIEGSFQSFGKDIVIYQAPGQQLAESHEVKTGLVIWDASVVLAKYFENEEQFPKDVLKDKRIIELGAGCGLVGISLALGLAANANTVILSDMPELIPLLRKNIDSNNCSSIAAASSLAWGESVQHLNPPFDLIIASDCLWVEYLVQPFVKSLVDLSDHNSTILISHEERARKTEERFVEIASQYFHIDYVSISLLNLDNHYNQVPLVNMHKQFRDRFIKIFKMKKKI